MILYILYVIFTALIITAFIGSLGRYDSSKHGKLLKFLKGRTVKVVILVLFIINAIVFIGLHVMCGVAIHNYTSGYGY